MELEIGKALTKTQRRESMKAGQGPGRGVFTAGKLLKDFKLKSELISNYPVFCVREIGVRQMEM